MDVLSIHANLILYEHVMYDIPERDRHALVPIISHSTFTEEISFELAMFWVFMLLMHVFWILAAVGFYCY